MRHTEQYRVSVLKKLAGPKPTYKVGQVTYEIDGKRYHIKVKTGTLKKYPFNINNAVLDADFEVYICGTDQLYYVVPVNEIKNMHDDPAAMPDQTHAGLTVIDVHPSIDRIVYGRGGKSMSIAAFRNVTL